MTISSVFGVVPETGQLAVADNPIPHIRDQGNSMMKFRRAASIRDLGIAISGKDFGNFLRFFEFGFYKGIEPAGLWALSTVFN